MTAEKIIKKIANFLKKVAFSHPKGGNFQGIGMLHYDRNKALFYYRRR